MQKYNQEPTYLACKRETGFTLLELLLVTSILGVIIGFGVPSLNEYMKLARATANQRDFISSLKFAHSEAVKRNSPVSICIAATKTADTCDTKATATWVQGWHVFADANANLVINNPLDIILHSSPSQSNSTLYTLTPQNGFTFQATGEISNLSASKKFTTCSYNASDLDCKNATEATKFAILASGQIVAL